MQKGVPRYFQEICNVSMSGEFAEALQATFRADNIELEAIPSLAEQRTFVRTSDNGVISSEPERIGGEKEI